MRLRFIKVNTHSLVREDHKDGNAAFAAPMGLGLHKHLLSARTTTRGRGSAAPRLRIGLQTAGSRRSCAVALPRPNLRRIPRAGERDRFCRWKSVAFAKGARWHR